MIIPAILEQSIDEIQKKLDRVKGLVDRVQIDIIDDHQTVSVEDLQRINFYDLAVDIHLMTDNPEQFLGQCLAMGSPMCVIGQIERMTDQKQFVKKAHQMGFRAGLALDLYTPISSLDISAKEEVDCILLMSVKAGFSGQHFNDRVLEKIKALRDSPYNGIIVMDGGEDPAHIKRSKEAGANEFAVGSCLWEHKDIAHVIASE